MWHLLLTSSMGLPPNMAENVIVKLFRSLNTCALPQKSRMHHAGFPFSQRAIVVAITLCFVNSELNFLSLQSPLNIPWIPL